MNALSNWWNNGSLGEVDTTVSIDRKSIIILAFALVVSAIVIITYSRLTAKK